MFDFIQMKKYCSELKIVVADDDGSVLNILTSSLEPFFKKTVGVLDGEAALDCLKSESFDLLLTDILMPKVTGIELIKTIRSSFDKSPEIIVLTGYEEKSLLLELINLNISAYLHKPLAVTDMLSTLTGLAKRIYENHELEYYRHHLEEQVNRQTKDIREINEQLKAEVELRRELEQQARNDAKELFVKKNELSESLNEMKNDIISVCGLDKVGLFSNHMQHVSAVCEKFHLNPHLPVVIEGPTGCGKEIIARLIHYGKSMKETKPFVAINCASIPPSLFESELFGSEPGAFTGALNKKKAGKFELAGNGTIFFVEISEIPTQYQAKLLRVIQEKEFYRLGSSEKIEMRARVITATNQNIKGLIEQGLFRSDLYFRLSMGRIDVLPLKERQEEVIPLAKMFLQDFCKNKPHRFAEISKEAGAILQNYSWPGNIRELKGVMERVSILYDDAVLKAEHLIFLNSKVITGSANATADQLLNFSLPEINFSLEKMICSLVESALIKHNGNKKKTADYLGVSRMSIYNYLKKSSRQEFDYE